MIGPAPVPVTEPSVAAASDISPPVTPERRPAIRVVPALAVIGGLWLGQVVLIPLVLSVLVSYALEPFVSRLESFHIARPFAVPLLLIALLGLTGFGIYSLRSDAASFIEQLPEAAHTVRQALQSDQRDQPGAVARVQQAARELEKAATDAAGPNRAPTGVTPVRIEEPTFRWSDYLWQGSRGAMEIAGQFFVMLCLVYYLLASGDLYKRKLVRIVGPSLSQKKIPVLPQRLGKVWASPSTWYHLVRKFGWRRPRLRVHGEAEGWPANDASRRDVAHRHQRHPPVDGTRVYPARGDRQLLSTDLGVAGRGYVCAWEQCGGACRSESGRDALRTRFGTSVRMT